MKVKNLNNSSKKTKILIKNTFAVMLSDKMELDKISITELCNKASISRGTFYSHYTDIYEVAEDYEQELIEAFFNKTPLIKQNIYEFIDSFFEFIKQNNENYKLICKSNDSLYAATKLAKIASNKLYEICKNDKLINDFKYIEFEIEMFIEGIFLEYVKYCRNYSTKTLDDLYDYTVFWVNNFIKNRS